MGRLRGRLLIGSESLGMEGEEVIEILWSGQRDHAWWVVRIGIEWDTQGVHDTSGWRVGVSLARFLRHT